MTLSSASISTDPPERASRCSHQDLLDDIGVIVWEAEVPALKFTYVSRQAERLLGYPVEQWLEEPDFWVRHLHDEEVKRCVEARNDCLDRGADYVLEYRLITSQEREVRVRDTVHVVKDETGRPVKLRGVMIDATNRLEAEAAPDHVEATDGATGGSSSDAIHSNGGIGILQHAGGATRASEELYRTIVNTTQEWIWEIDLDGIHRFSNPAIESILGYSPSEVVGQSSLLLMHEEDRKQIESKLPEMMNSPDGWTHWVIRWRHKNGSIRYLESNAVPILDANGNLAGYRGADRDITERVEAEKELQSRERELAHVSRLSTMGELAAGVAHELNQPLTAMSNFASAAMQVLEVNSATSEPLGDAGLQVKDWLQCISEQAVRCGEIIRRMRRFAQKEDSQRHRVNVSEVIQDSIAILSSVIREHSVRLDVRIPQPNLPVTANQAELQQVFVNVLRNACDTTVEAQVEFPTVTIEAKTSDGNVIFSIEDNGPGVDPGAIDKLFDPFFTTRGDGMGMGMAISRSIIENHGGRMWLDQHPSCGGARFQIELPLDGSSELDSLSKLDDLSELDGSTGIAETSAAAESAEHNPRLRRQT